MAGITQLIDNANKELNEISNLCDEIKKGKKYSKANLDACGEKLACLQKISTVCSEILKKNEQPGVKASPTLLVAQTALDNHQKLLKKVTQVASSVGIEPKISPASFSGKPAFPWLRETPLLDAVRKHDYNEVLKLRAEGESSIASDAKGWNALFEAVQQQDKEMVLKLLLPLDVLNNKEAGIAFWTQYSKIEERLTTLRKEIKEPSDSLSAHHAAYVGDIDKLKELDDIDALDSQGFAPIHYAIVSGLEYGRNHEAVAYLLSRCNHYVLTANKQTLLDFAIIHRCSPLYTAFEMRLPFTLDVPAEKGKYLLASGLIMDQLQEAAKKLDPIGMGGKDQDFLGLNLNLTWGLSLLGHRYLSPGGWGSWMCSFVGSYAHAINRFPIGMPQVRALLPHTIGLAMSKAHNAIAYASIASLVLDPFSQNIKAAIAKMNLMPRDSSLETIGSGMYYVSTAYTALRLIGAVRPVLARIPAYIKTFPSRPKAVAYKLGMDGLNIALQGMMAYTPHFTANNSAAS